MAQVVRAVVAAIQVVVLPLDIIKIVTAIAAVLLDAVVVQVVVAAEDVARLYIDGYG